MSSSNDADGELPKPPDGIFIGKGTKVTIPPGGLSIGIGADGQPFVSPLTIHLAYDVTPMWLEVALRHLQDAHKAHGQTIAVWKGTDEDAKLSALERQVDASMQTIIAVATAIDAFYAVVKGMIEIEAETLTAWRTNKTARHIQIVETLKRAFQVKDVAKISDLLEQLYRFRGWAVHPPADAAAPVYHAELNVSTEWRFFAFRYENALGTVRIGVSVVSELLKKPRDKWKDLVGYSESALPRIEAVRSQFEEFWREVQATQDSSS